MKREPTNAWWIREDIETSKIAKFALFLIHIIELPFKANEFIRTKCKAKKHIR